MIKLSDDAISTYTYLSLPTQPSYAQMVGVSSSYLPPASGSSLPASGATCTAHADYQVGILDAVGNFIGLTRVGTDISTANLQTRTFSLADAAKWQMALYNLLGAGTAPSPSDPTIPVSVPTKVAGDFKRADLECIIALYDPRLRGTIV